MKRRQWGMIATCVILSGVVGCDKKPVKPVVELANPNAIESLVGKATHGLAHVKRIFPGPQGLTGIVVAGEGKPPLVLWTNHAANLLLVGGLYDRKGENLTQLAYSHFVPQPAPVPAAAPSLPPVPPAAGHLLGSGVFDPKDVFFVESKVRSSLPKIYVFFDPNCIWCHKLYVEMTPEETANVNISWIPVGFLSETSKGKAERILFEGIRALDKDERNFDEAREIGGVTPLSRPALARKVGENLVALGKIGPIETPTIVYRTKEGFRAFQGFPTAVVRKEIFSSVR